LFPWHIFVVLFCPEWHLCSFPFHPQCQF
jgi:hypothetical protein